MEETLSAPEIVECTITRRVTAYAGDVVRDKLYAFSEILMTDDRGRHYCSRTWDNLTDSPHARAYQIAQFKARWEANRRMYPNGNQFDHA